MTAIEELKKSSDEQVVCANNAKEICEQEALIWDFSRCKEKGCIYTYRQKYHCGTYGCVHCFSEWSRNRIPFEDKYKPKEKGK